MMKRIICIALLLVSGCMTGPKQGASSGWYSLTFTEENGDTYSNMWYTELDEGTVRLYINGNLWADGQQDGRLAAADRSDLLLYGGCYIERTTSLWLDIGTRGSLTGYMERECRGCDHSPPECGQRTTFEGYFTEGAEDN